SQLGMLVVLFGYGTPATTAAGCVMLVAHALFKATLFLAVGAIDRHTATRDIRLIPTLGRDWQPLKIIVAVCAGSMAGLPLLFGFVGKEAAFAALEAAGG